MNIITIVILICSVFGAVDLLIDNKIGIGKELQKAFLLFCPMATSMLGMQIFSPAFGEWLRPFFESFYALFGLDPSIISASPLANQSS